VHSHHDEFDSVTPAELGAVPHPSPSTGRSYLITLGPDAFGIRQDMSDEWESPERSNFQLDRSVKIEAGQQSSKSEK